MGYSSKNGNIKTTFLDRKLERVQMFLNKLLQIAKTDFKGKIIIHFFDGEITDFEENKKTIYTEKHGAKIK